MRFKKHTIAQSAVAYYRHSAEDKQENSVAKQREETLKLAYLHQVAVIHEEADEGESGLSANRPGFQRLFNDWILNKNAPPFEYVLVYNESRWGRFLDQDEAAYFEFLCKQHGKQVVYISLGFPKEHDDPLVANILKSIGRSMSAKYVRDLSEEVFKGCKKVSEQGYSVGGTPCYGMARLLLDVEKKPVGVLKHGEHKAISNARVTFVPRNDETTQTVRDIFHLFVDEWKNPDTIAGILNEKGITAPRGGRWNHTKTLRILTNEMYTGTLLYNKRWGRLSKSRVKNKTRKNPRSVWVIVHNAFPEIVNRGIFEKAQERLYWSMPSRWKRGIYAIRKAHRTVQQELTQLFLEQGTHQDNMFLALRCFPLLYGVPFSFEQSALYWCFAIPPEMRRHKYVVGIGITIDQHGPVDRIFVIPTDDFGVGDFHIFSEKDNAYAHYYVKDDEIEKTILHIALKLGINAKASSPIDHLQF